MPGIPGWPDDYNPYAFNVRQCQQGHGDGAHGARHQGHRPARRRDAGWQGDRARRRASSSSATTATPATRRASPTWPVPGATNLGFSEQPVRHHAAPTSRVFRTERPPGQHLRHHPQRLGRGLPAPGQPAPRPVRDGRRQQQQRLRNPAFDLLLGQASVEQDPTKAHELYVRAQRLLVDDAPVIWLEYARQPRPGQAVRRRRYRRQRRTTRTRRPVPRDHPDHAALIRPPDASHECSGPASAGPERSPLGNP